MRRTHLCKLLSVHNLRRLTNLKPPFHPARPLPTPISSPEPYVSFDSNNPSYFANHRFYSGESKPAAKDVDVSKVVDDINLKFMEAREDIEQAMESKETVYFNLEAEVAGDAVKQVLDMYEGLLGRLGEVERGVLQRSMGMKIEQLKAELEQLDEYLD